MKTIEEMSHEELENLCSRCGLCCRMPIVIPTTAFKGAIPGKVVAVTQIVCDHLNPDTLTCEVYTDPDARRAVSCMNLTKEMIMQAQLDNDNLIESDGHTYVLHDECEYIRRRKGLGLHPQHPDVTGNPTSMADWVKEQGLIKRTTKRGDVAPEQIFKHAGVDEKGLRGMMAKHFKENVK